MVIGERASSLEKSGGRSGPLPPQARRSDREPRIRDSDAPLSLDELVAEVSHPGAGGIATFLGVVRDMNDGRAVTLLEYEAYGSMAEAELAPHPRARSPPRCPGVRVAATHRVGALQVGDVAVACAASAPHRGEAFRACRLLIDRIKARLPIWKREHGPDGPYWVGWEDARCLPDHGDHDHAGEGHRHAGVHDKQAR